MIRLLILSMGFVSSAFAAPSGKVQVQTDYSNQYIYSPQSSGGVVKFISKDSGMAWRVRAAFPLFGKEGPRSFEVLFGPFIRVPLAFALTGYGNDIRGPTATQFGFDAGVSFWSYLRVLMTASPYWSLSYQSSDLAEGKSQLDELTYRHFTYGLRFEIPLLILESDPGDHRVEFGALFSASADKITSYRISAVNHPKKSTLIYDADISGGQKSGVSFLFGAFMNFRI